MSEPIAPQEIAGALAPIEQFFVAPHLDGSQGANRGNGGRPLIAATNDVDTIKAWLARFTDTKTTFDNYRKEAERLLLWTTVQLGKPFSSLSHEDLLAYQHFLADPKPADRWVMRDGRKFARSHPEWRPFAGQPSPVHHHPQHPLLLAGQRRSPAIRFPCLVNAPVKRNLG